MDNLLDGFEASSFAQVKKQQKQVQKKTEEDIPDDDDDDDIEEDVRQEPSAASPAKDEEKITFDIEECDDAREYTSQGIVHFDSVGGKRFMLTDNGYLYIYWEDENGFNKLSYNNEGEPIVAFSVDPKGLHMLSFTKGKEVLYINCGDDIRKYEEGAEVKKNKMKKLPKLKGCDISAIGWDKTAQLESSAGNILIGTRNGAVLEVRADPKESPKTLFDIKDSLQGDRDTKITSIEVERYPGSQSKKMVVIIATASHIYQFIGGPVFTLVLNCDVLPAVIPAPQGKDDKDNVGMTSLYRNRKGVVKAFAWATPTAILHGRFKFSNPKLTPFRLQNDKDDFSQEFRNDLNGSESVIQYTYSIPYTEVQPLVGLSITAYHIFLVYVNKMVVLAHPAGMNWVSSTEPVEVLKKADLEARIVLPKPISKGLGAVVDRSTKQIFYFTRHAVFEVKPTNWESTVWKRYLERAVDPKEEFHAEYFRKAYRLCQRDPEKCEAVLRAKGDFHFGRKEFLEAAKVYALANRSFEEVCLRFLEINNVDALLKFLVERVRVLKNRDRDQDRVQLECLTAWCLEIFLDKLNTSPDDNLPSLEETFDGLPGAGRLKRTRAEKHLVKQMKSVYEASTSELKAFFEKFKGDINRAVAFRLMTSHGRIKEVLYLAEKLSDYDTIIQHYIISYQDYNAATDILIRRVTAADKADSWYRFSPLLIQYTPRRLVEGWMGDVSSFLQPPKLLPAMSKYDPVKHNSIGEKENHVIRYLEWLTGPQKNEDPEIHNLLVALYVCEGNEKDLLSFVHRSASYDCKSALRTCMEAKKFLPCVHIYSKMGLYEDAVHTALRAGNLKLAIENAGAPPDDDIQLKRKLWLQIAKHIVETDVSAAIALLKTDENNRGVKYIKLEEILPFFPDTVLIQDFKKEIGESLEDYNNEREDLIIKMNEATQHADAIRHSVKDLRGRYGNIIGSQQCEICSIPAIAGGDGYFMFPNCRHVFHRRCAALEFERFHKELKARVQAMKKIEYVPCVTPIDVDNLTWGELENQAGQNCLFCSALMVETTEWDFEIGEDDSWSIAGAL